MYKINLSAVPVDELQSPKNRYHSFSQDITHSMRQNNGSKDKPNMFPFEVSLVRLPPRAANWPFHSHSSQWEFYMVVVGRGKLRTAAGEVELREGDCVAQPPGEPHQIINSGASDLIYYAVAQNQPSDVQHFPDSGKWTLPGQNKTYRLQPMSCFDGEE